MAYKRITILKPCRTRQTRTHCSLHEQLHSPQVFLLLGSAGQCGPYPEGLPGRRGIVLTPRIPTYGGFVPFSNARSLSCLQASTVVSMLYGSQAAAHMGPAHIPHTKGLPAPTRPSRCAPGQNLG